MMINGTLLAILQPLPGTRVYGMMLLSQGKLLFHGLKVYGFSVLLQSHVWHMFSIQYNHLDALYLVVSLLM